MRGVGKHVFVVGPRRAQNELLASYLQARCGAECRTASSLKALSEARASRQAEPCLILKDCPAREPEAVRRRLESARPLVQRCLVALFNVAAGRGLEKELFPCGVRGFFYENDGTETLLKGVNALFDGELWMSRKVMSECLVGGVREGAAGSNAAGLTPREVEVLRKVAAGGRNDEIAAQLCISPHTVKTHAYRIFRKIGAENRLQAALWAASNL